MSFTTNLDLSRLDTNERVDLSRATYFMLESYFDGDEHNLLASIEEATDASDGAFAIHIGLPDRPARRYALTFTSFDHALLALAELKRSHPTAGMWLSCQEILAEIEGDDVWRGAIKARASFDPTDLEDDWICFAEFVAECDACGLKITPMDPMHDLFENLAEHLNTISRHVDVASPASP